MVTIAKKIAETLFKHDPATLLHAMTKQQSFKDFVLPDVDESEAGYRDFTQNKAVRAVKEAVGKTTTVNNARRTLLSLLADDR